jgi:hypothetical protein
MITYTYSQARQHFKDVLDMAAKEEVIIQRKNGTAYSIKLKKVASSPFDIKGIKTKVTTEDIIKAIRESRER